MRFRHIDGTLIHLGYCTNVHPAETLDGVLAQLRDFAKPVRDHLNAPLLGVGLWLSRTVVDELLEQGTDELAQELAANGLEVVTLNGFPYGGFHDPEVKYTVYTPDWSQIERLNYTLDLADILARLLPDDALGGSISTLPLMWRTVHDDDTVAAAESMVDSLAVGLDDIARRTGKTIRVAFEPEPGCIVEDAAGAVAHLHRRDRLGVCFDACHSAVQFDEPEKAVATLIDGGLPIVKLQASCALTADPGDQDALADFVEPRFLHQVRSRHESFDDLPLAIDSMNRDDEWRVHFHVPIHAAAVTPLRTTAEHLVETLRVMFAGARALTNHIEVETYTWSVLPGASPDSIVENIAAELEWLIEQLLTLGTVTAEYSSAPVEVTA